MSYTNTNTNIRTRARYSRRRQAREPDVRRDATRDETRDATRRAAYGTARPHGTNRMQSELYDSLLDGYFLITSWPLDSCARSTQGRSLSHHSATLSHEPRRRDHRSEIGLYPPTTIELLPTAASTDTIQLLPDPPDSSCCRARDRSTVSSAAASRRCQRRRAQPAPYPP
jgi:hypothetical protein